MQLCHSPIAAVIFNPCHYSIQRWQFNFKLGALPMLHGHAVRLTITLVYMMEGRKMMKHDSENICSTSSFRNHQAKCIHELDDGYIQWMLNNFPESSAVDVMTLKQKMKQSEKRICNVHTLLTDLKSCSMRRDLQQGRRIHVKAVESRHDSNMHVATALIRMYGKCGSMVNAHRIFDNIQKPDVVCWTTLLMGYADNGDALVTLDLFSKMKDCGCAPDSVTYIVVLKACTSLAGKRDGTEQVECLKRGRTIHSEIGCDLSVCVQNALITLYAKCGSMVDARCVFDSIPNPDVVSWTALLLGYVENGDGFATLELFTKMKACGCTPDSVTYVAALKACTNLSRRKDSSGQNECLKRGREIHYEIGVHLDIYVQSTLIDMYSNCGSMVDAHCVFDSIQKPNVVAWNALLLGYAENGNGIATFDMFSRMKACGCAADSVTYVAALKACTSLAGKPDGSGRVECLKWGREIHSEIGCISDIFVQNTLIDMYANCGSMIDARRAFDSIRKPNVVSWTALLLGYAENGDGLATLDLFSKMKACGCAPDSVAYVAVIKACSSIGALTLGRKFHSEIREFSSHIVTCVVDLYAKCGSIVEAREVFDTHLKARDVSTWTVLLTGYGSLGDTVSVFNLFEAMKEQGFKPDAVTFVCMLSCCSHAGLVTKAREYFDAMPVYYGVTPTVMHYTCMVDVLGRANWLSEAIAMVQKMPCNPNAVTWMTLLGACRKWKNVEIGRFAFQSVVEMDKMNATAYVVMAHIYGSRGMWDEQEKVLESRMKLATSKLLGQAYVYDKVGNMVKFMVGDEDPPEIKIELQKLLESFKKRGNNMSGDAKQEEAMCGHCERRAVVYGHLKTPPGEPVRAFKNMRMCDNCHKLTKIVSELHGRVIMVRDTSKFHVMVNGSCSCGDYW